MARADLALIFRTVAPEAPEGDWLGERLEAALVREEWSQNPFLRPFYEGSAGAAFQAELFFLLTRFRQQQERLQQLRQQ